VAAKIAASAAPEAVAHPRVVGGLMGIAGDVFAAGVAARRHFSGAVHAHGVARDMSYERSSVGARRFRTFFALSMHARDRWRMASCFPRAVLSRHTVVMRVA
jgi:hypothetical protein